MPCATVRFKMVRTFSKNVLIQLFIGAGLLVLAVAIGQGRVLIAFTVAFVSVWAAGATFSWWLARRQRRRSGRNTSSTPRHHQEFDDAI